MTFNLAFTADTSQAKAQLRDLQMTLTNLSKPTGQQGKLGITEELVKAQGAAADLGVALKQSMTSTGSLDLSKFNASLKASGLSLSDYRIQLAKLGPEGSEAFLKVAQSVMNAEAPIRRTNGLLKQFGTTLMNTARWQISSSILHGFMGALQSAYGYAKDLNESLNNIRIVTGHSTDQMASFAKEANAAAQALGTTTTKYTDAALIFYQQGLEDSAVKERTDAVIKMANVTKDSETEVSSYMTAIWNNFEGEKQNLEAYADTITALGAATAASSAEIAGGLEKFAAIGQEIGLSYDYATTALATVVANTRQSEDVVGTAFKTIFARIQGLKLGETLDDGTDLNKYSSALNSVGVQIKDASGELRNMDEILDDLGQKWNTLDRDQQVALAQTVAGVRQYTQLIALMDSWETDFQDNLKIAQNSEGSLQKQQDIYAESWEAASKRVKASMEGIYDQLLDDKFFIKITDALANIISGVGSFIDKIGGLGPVLSGISFLIFKAFGSNIASAIDNITMNIYHQTEAYKKEEEALRELAFQEAEKTFNDMASYEGEATSQAYKTQLALQRELKKSANELSEQSIAELQARLDIVDAYRQQVQAMAKAKDQSSKAVADSNNTLLKNAKRNLSNNETANYDMQEVRDSISNLRELTEATAQAEDRFNALQIEFENTGSINSFLTNIQNLENELMQLKDINGESIFQENGETFTYLNSLQQELVNLRASVTELKTNFDWSELDQECAGFTDRIINLESILASGNVDEYKAQLAALAQEVPKDSQAFKFLQQAIKQVNGVSKNLSKGFKEIKLNGGLASYTALDLGEAADKLAQKFGWTVEETEAFMKSVRQLRADGLSLEDAIAQAGISVEEFKNKLEMAKQAAANFSIGKTIVQSFQGISQITMGITSLSNAISTLQDPDASSWEKFSTVLMSTGMSIPMIIGGLQSLHKTYIAITTAMSALATITETETGLTLTMASAEEILQGKKAGSLVLYGLMNTVQKTGLPLKIATTAATWAEKAAEDGKTTSLWAQLAAKLANNAADAIMLALILLIVAAIAALVLVVVAVVAAFKAWEESTPEAKLERASALVDDLTERVGKLKDEYNALKEAIADYQDVYDAFSEMSVSAEGYAEKLEEVNEKARELIDTYNLQGQWHYDKNGAIAFDEGALDNIQAQKRQQIDQTESRLYGAQIRQADAKIKVIEADTKKFVGQTATINNNNPASSRPSYTTQNQYVGTEADLQDLAKLKDEQYSLIKHLADQAEVAEDSWQTAADTIGLTGDKTKLTAEEVKHLADVVGKLGDSADTARDDIIKANEQREEAVKNLASNTVQDNKDFQKIAGGDQVAINAAANILAHNKDFNDKVDQISVEAEAPSRGKVADMVKDHGYGDYSGVFDDEELMDAYAKVVLGMTQEELDSGTTYEAGSGKGTLKDDQGNILVQLDDNAMEQAIATALATQDAQDEANAENSQIMDDINNTVQILKDLGPAGEIALQGLQNWDPEKTPSIPLDLAELSPEQVEQLQGAAKEIGGEYEKALTEALANYNVDDYKKRQEQHMSEMMDKDANRDGIDTEKLDLQTQLIQSNTEAFKNNENAAKQLAINNTRLNKGLATLTKNWKTWSVALKSTDKTTDEYAQTLLEVQDCIGEMLGLTDNLKKKLPATFLQSEKTAKLLSKAAEGNAKAIAQLGVEATKEITKSMKLSDELQNATEDMTIEINGDNIDASQFQSRLDSVKSSLDTTLTQMQESIANGKITPGQLLDDNTAAEFASKLNEMAILTGMTVEDMQGYLDSLGVQANIQEEAKPVTSQVPIVETWEDVKDIDQEKAGYKLKSRTYTKTVGYETVTEQKMVPQIAFSRDGSKVPQPIRYVGHGNASPSNSGGSKSGGGGGGGSSSTPKEKETKEHKKVRDEKERYHPVLKRLEALQAAYDKVSAAKDRAFGVSKLNNIAKEIKMQEALLKTQKDYVAQIKVMRALDKSTLANNYGAKFDKYGNVSNYHKLWENQVKEYNRAVDKYNKSDQEDADKKLLEKAETKFENFKKALDQYEETVSLYAEQLQVQQEMINKIHDLKVEKIVSAVDAVVAINDTRLDRLNYQLERLDRLAFNIANRYDILTKRSTALRKESSTLESGLKKLLENEGFSKYSTSMILDPQLGVAGKQTIIKNELEKLKRQGKELSEEAMTQLTTYADKLIEINQQLQEDMITAVTLLHDQWSAVIEDMDVQSSKLNSLKSIADSYLNIIDLAGQKHLGITNDTLSDLYQQQNTIAKNNFAAAVAREKALKESYDALVNEVNIKPMTAEQKEQWKKDKQEMEADLTSAAEEVASSWQEALQTATDTFQKQMELVASTFKDSIAGAAGSLDLLSSHFDRQKQQSERYVADYEKIYQLSKLNRDLEKTMDESDNANAKKALLDFQQKIVNKQQQGVQMSQYELDYLQKEYELKKASLALDEAQNTKSKVQMKRNAEGSYSYVYTADQNEVAQAEQEYEDKLLAMQQANDEYINNLQENVITLEQEWADALQEVWTNKELTDEQKKAEVDRLQEFYQSQKDYLVQELETALQNSKTLYEDDWASYSQHTGYKISLEKDWLDTWDETFLKQETDYKTLQEYSTNFDTAIQKSVETSKKAFETWGTTVADIMDIASVDITDPATKIKEMFNDITKSVKNTLTALEQLAKDMPTIMSKAGKSYNEWQATTGANNKKAIADNNAAVQGIDNTVALAQTYKPHNKNGQYDIGDVVTLKKGSVYATKGDGLIGWDKYTSGKKKGQYKRSKRAIPGKILKIRKNNVKIGYRNLNKSYHEAWVKKTDITGYDTGGYTGAWGSEGKLAMLHQKELVLNKTDTTNFLKTIDMVRDIVKTIDLNAITAAGGLRAALTAITPKFKEDILQQEVTIHADFPNVTDRDQIKDAFNDLVNLASQYANRKQ